MAELRPLITAARIADRVKQLAQQIGEDVDTEPLHILVLLDGAFCFVADLVRALPLTDVRLHFVRASSYRSGTESTGRVDLGSFPDVSGERILVVDDILDTGRTLDSALAAIDAGGAASTATCVLLDKPARRDPSCQHVQARYVGFTIPDTFVVGYGLDYNGRYRHLPDVHELI